MADVQARSQTSSSRGRGGGRGGRGGYVARNSTNRKANGATDSPIDDDNDVSQLRKQHGAKLDMIKEMFPDWSDADILYALKETDGDAEVAATRIADGTISQWGEVSKPKKTAARPKAKDAAPSTGLTESSGNSRPARGGRTEGGRGGRGRGAERARGGRGRATAHPTTNGHQTKENQQLSVPTEESNTWANTAASNENNAWKNSAWGTTDTTTTESTTTPTPAPASAPAPASTESAAKPAVIPQGTTKTWASMLRQSTAPKPAPKVKEAPAPQPAETIEPLPATEPSESEPEPPVDDSPKEVVPEPVAAEAPKIVEPEVALPPSEDDLTKTNLEQLPDESHPLATATVASTAADSWDPRQQQAQHSTVVTPLSASQAQHQPRPTASGFAATALKATERPAQRVPSYQRRLMEQEEAVRMPGNREVDRAAVQFGAFNLNDAEEDIDGEREDPETRAQPPPESPIAPRAALPPVSQPAPVPEAFPAAQKQTPSLPQAPVAAATPVAPPTGPAATTAQRMLQYPQFPQPTNSIIAPQAPASSQPYSRFPPAAPQEPAGFPQKPYESFGQQAPATSGGSFDSFPASTTQAPGPQVTGAFSSAPNDYSSYYTSDGQARGAYGNYYGQQYGQQGGQSHHEGPNAPSRPFGGYNASQNDNLSQYPQSGIQQSRYPGAAAAEAHNSGHNTPNPVGQTQQQGSGQTNPQQSNLHQQPPANSFPYGQHPYYSSPYYAQYMSQYGGYGQGGYGGGPYGKGSVYGQPHQYGMSPQGPFDHGSSPAAGGFGQSSLGGRDSGLGSGIDNYGRAGSTQSGAPGGLGSGGFGGMHDAFGRGSGYPSQGGQSFGGPNAPASNAGAGNDDLKPYSETKATGGPSPSLAAAARPGSTANATPAGSGLPPPQSSQQGIGSYGGYPSHLSHGLHGNQTGSSGYGLGGSGGQGHGNTPYGSYGQGFGGNYYGGRQQGGQGGWGGNYH
ncbi:hypothetical protein F5Y15DRAFT_399334 [Xylariaceae sp. FL0016]|nr:hypothetical protein F5Y15DRAFT_399334 [Xylariaceae sp. FL0016]